MNVGGYQIIDLKNFPFDSSKGNSVVIDGIYEKIEGTLKPILLTGIVINDMEVRNLFVFPSYTGSSYGIFFGSMIDNVQGFEISSSDVVTMIM